MKDLKLNKENIVSLKESQLEETIGGNHDDIGLEVTCRRKSCGLSVEE